MNALVSEPGRPRLTWYGDDGERVELSGSVLENWMSKTTNLLVEEFDAAPGSRVLLDLPVHWRTAVWALASWRCGATVVLPSAAPPGPPATAPDRRPVDVAITTRPAELAAVADDVVAVALPALARRFGDDLPPGALDAASAVMTYADAVLFAPETDLGEPALLAPAEPAPVSAVLHGDLLPWALRDAPAEHARVLVDGRLPGVEALRRTLAAWAVGGSVVLTSAGTAAALEADPERRRRIAEQEGVTA
ncbi:TIGR03089 family protein [Xylanimonas oleitrophica]|uniref:TIGR03089 family protein n=2 Tax=Xylanimonas oleitrophica TaxID=2607479 RepID=A0A2W5WUX9_9MICO|nr:TIGR03089 family protein [Xylanimonas oleitrophica]PZR54433.1 TIGR03089 family protein [Xylanimonas oleitrophica]